MADTAQPTGQENTNTGSTDGDQAAAMFDSNASNVVDEKPAADGTTDTKTEEVKDDQTEKKDDGEKKPDDAVPEKYDLKPPEGMQLDEVLLGEFEPLAKELKLTNDGAQKLVETMMPKVVARVVEQQQAAWEQTLESWVGEINADKEIGGDNLKATKEAAEKALARFGSKDLTAMLGYRTAENPKGLGLGNHPELVRVFAKIGKAMSEDTFHNSNSNASGVKDAADVMFGGKS